jgi:hypothetical protein
MGRTVLRSILDRNDVELVGVYVTSDRKNGRDAGSLVRRPDTGIIATNDIEAILALDADAVFHTSLLTAPYDTQNGQVARLLRSGKNVLSANGFFRPGMHGEAYAKPLLDAALAGDVTLAGVGLNPGFIGERLALLCAGMVNGITAIRASEVFDASMVPSAELIAETIGLGVDPELSSLTVGPIARMYDQLFPEVIDYVAAKLGTRLVTVEPRHQLTMAPADIHMKAMTIPRGTVAAVEWIWRGSFENGIVMELKVLWTGSRALHGESEGAHWHVEIDGRPNLRFDLEIESADPNAPPGLAPMEAMAALFLNALPHVIAAPAGFFDLPAVMPAPEAIV